ncbi:E3 ubiquitin-protein ligase TRIM32 [Lepeophtheirus salmonis]|nr:brain tumor protein-like [Lepeophtheirus salmonis]
MLKMDLLDMSKMDLLDMSKMDLLREDYGRDVDNYNVMTWPSKEILSPKEVSSIHVANVVSKFGIRGSLPGHLNSPHGFCFGVSGEIVVADTFNHRIQVFDKAGQLRFGFGGPGKGDGKFWFPRKIAMIRDFSKNLVICDRGSLRSRMQIFSLLGQFVRKIEIQFIDIVAGLTINEHNNIVVVDSVTPAIFVITQYGDLIKYIECKDYMIEPSDIAVYQNEYYVCDFKGFGVVVLGEDGQLIKRIGGFENVRFPNGIDISDDGCILIGDSHGNEFHIAIFSKSGLLLCQYICPHVKVSRCCGLKITPEGYIITVAKNNHHVLILDTLTLKY